MDATGTILEQQRYLPFGEPRPLQNFTTISLTDYTYTGQRNLTGTGLMDYRARFYSPSLKRFIQPDSLIPGMANSQSWNRYSSVKNNPINFNDPTGHVECEPGSGDSCMSPGSTSTGSANISTYTPSSNYPGEKPDHPHGGGGGGEPDRDLEEDLHSHGEFKVSTPINYTIGLNEYAIGCHYWNNADGSMNMDGCTTLDYYYIYNNRVGFQDFINAPLYYTSKDFVEDFSLHIALKAEGLVDPFGILDTTLFIGDVSTKSGEAQRSALNYTLNRAFFVNGGETAPGVQMQVWNNLYNSKNQPTSVVIVSNGRETFMVESGVGVSDFQTYLNSHIP